MRLASARALLLPMIVVGQQEGLMMSKPVCSILWAWDPYPWGPSCGATRILMNTKLYYFCPSEVKKIPHNDAIWEVKKQAHKHRWNGMGLD